MAFLSFPKLFNRPAKPQTVRRFDGAADGRRGFGMGTFGRANSEVSASGATLRSRARYLTNNNPWLSQAVANWAGALVGSGIVPTPKHPDTTTRADAGTVEAVISTFAPVQRKGFMERLDPAGLDTSRLIGAPVLDGHRQGSARDVIGTIAGHRMEDG